MMPALPDILRRNRIIPVIVIDRVEHAIPLATTLISADFFVLEITLRTACALDVIKQIVLNVPKAIVGAGTVINTHQLSQAQEAGAQFVVSPGFSPQLFTEAKKRELAYLPGVATPSEALCAHELGATHLKFFPAESMGGVTTLSAIAEVLPLHFCPTGGINGDNFINYLALPCVPCVGGTWITPRHLIQANAFDDIAKRAQHNQSLIKSLY